MLKSKKGNFQTASLGIFVDLKRDLQGMLLTTMLSGIAD
jgi:hypothetical protein